MKTSTKPDYYDGSAEPVSMTSAATRKLEKRRILTKTSQRLVVVLVGLPGRGKSFISRKLHAYLTWRGNACKVFNVGKYRRGAKSHAAPISEDTIDDSQKQKKRGEVGACDANFFDTNNKEATKLREEVAMMALQDMLQWLDNKDATSTNSNALRRALSGASNASNDGPDRRESKIAIFDATNSTKERRDMIMRTCKDHCNKSGTPPIGIIFIETICDDKELLEENYLYKIRNSPDFEGLSEEQAMADLRMRAAKYEERYETIDDDSLSYVKIFNFSSKILANNVYGRSAKIIVPALMAWHVGERPIFLCRAGKTFADDLDMDVTLQSVEWNKGSNGSLDTPSHRGGQFSSMVQISNTPNNNGASSILDNSSHSQRFLQDRANRKGISLNAVGDRFRIALAQFIANEGEKFMERRNNALKDHRNGRSSLISLGTGTSQTGTSTVVAGIHADADTLLKSFSKSGSFDFSDEMLDIVKENKCNVGIPLFPCYILTSTMPRAIQTATWDNLPFEMSHVSNLNPIDKGDFTGLEMEEISELEADWYGELSKNPFTTRFPGGESYQDVVSRLESIVIEMEQQLAPVVLVSHVSVIQVLLAYFRQTPVKDCTKIEVPMHTVIELRPLLGGGWQEVQHTLIQDEGSDGSSQSDEGGVDSPIWGDRKERRASSFKV